MKTGSYLCQTLEQRLGIESFDTLNFKNYKLSDGLVVRNNKRFITKSITKDDCLAFDSETHRGFCKLLSDSDGRYILNPTFKECLDFLFYKASQSNYYRFFYNIDFDISAIFKLFNSNLIISELLKGKKMEIEGYKVYWLKGHLFSLSKGKKSVVYTDINAFLHMKLDSAVKTYVDKSIGKDKIDGKLLNKSLDYWNQNLDDIIKYCIKDCKLTQKLGKVLIDNLDKVGIEKPRYLVSSASLSKAHFRKHCYIPSIENIPHKIMDIAWKTYHGGRFEILKRGYFPSVYLYDINSEYPTKIRDLPSLKYGYWSRVNKLNDNEVIGFYKVKIFIPPEVKISTSIFKASNDLNMWINGYNEGWFTWYDLDLIREYIIDIDLGYEYIPNEKEYYPFRDVVDDLYEKKSHYKFDLKDDMMTLVVKLTLNAFYGCCIETHTRYTSGNNKIFECGILFNAVYGSIITAFGRWIILKSVKKENWNHLLAFHTDSIISDIPLKELDIGNNLGQWNLEAFGRALIINTGIYQIGNCKCKTRGIPNRFIKNWFMFCRKKKNVGLTIREFSRERMIKISEALQQDKNLARLNTMDNVLRSVNINSDNKRTWKDNFSDFRDLLSRNIDSLPHFNTIDENDDTILIHNPLLAVIS